MFRRGAAITVLRKEARLSIAFRCSPGNQEASGFRRGRKVETSDPLEDMKLTLLESLDTGYNKSASFGPKGVPSRLITGSCFTRGTLKHYLPLRK